jgi:hypothetical protein
MWAVVLAASLVAMLATMASAAGASSWRTNGGSFNAATGAGTLSVFGSNITCAGATATGTVAAGTGPVYPSKWTAVAVGTAIFTPCRVSGVVGYAVHCSYNLVASSHNLATSGGHPFGSETTFGDTSVACTVCLGNTVCRTVTGTVPFAYSNPTGTGGTSKLIVATNSGGLTVSGTQQCLLDTGPGHLTNLVFHLPSGPSIWVL